MLHRGLHFPYAKALAYLQASGMTQADAANALCAIKPAKLPGRNAGLLWLAWDLQTAAVKAGLKPPPAYIFMTSSQRSRRQDN